MLTAVSNIMLALPAAAEAGKIFDFNATLPVMVGEFLILMLFLDKFWFTPVGNFLDERDAMIRNQLASVGDNSAEIARLEADAEDVLKKARTEAQAQIQAARAENQAIMDEQINAAKEEVDKELEVALAALEKEKEEAMKTLDTQIDSLSAEILTRILPEGVKV